MKLRICIPIILMILMNLLVSAQPVTPNYHQLKKIAVGGDGFWDYLTFDSPTHRLFVGRGTHAIAIDVEQEKVVGDIANTPGVHGVAVVPKLNRGFTSNGREDTVTVFDLTTYKEIARIPVGHRPDAIIYDPASNRVFTVNGGSQDATAIDPATATVVGTLPLGGGPEFPVADGKGQVFVNIEDKNEIVAFDARSLTIKHRWPLGSGDGPSGLAMDREHRRLFSVCSNEVMVVMDADSGRVVATPAIGKGADAAAFDPETGLAFSSNGRDGTLTVIKETSPEKFDVLATVTTQTGARTMALDPATHKVYLATAKLTAPPADTTTTPPQGGANAPHRPHFVMEPNSFTILVYGP